MSREREPLPDCPYDQAGYHREQPAEAAQEPARSPSVAQLSTPLCARCTELGVKRRRQITDATIRSFLVVVGHTIGAFLLGARERHGQHLVEQLVGRVAYAPAGFGSISRA